ncbi:tetratricopeptide repeat protein [Rubripirellula amarantea]|nr:tetratricopeptide repeat protein [Rubripirellula amarantea]
MGASLFLPAVMGPSLGRNTIGFNLPGISPWEYFTSQPFVFLQYLKLTFLPFNLSLDYGWLPSRNPARQWLGFLMWVMIIAFITWLWRRSKPAGSLALIAGSVMSPTSTILPLQDIIFEHRMYLPLACLMAGLVSVASLKAGLFASVDTIEADRTETPTPPVAAPSLSARWLFVPIVIAIAFSVLTVLRNYEYHTYARVAQRDTENNPDNPRAWVQWASANEYDTPEPSIQMMEHALALAEDRDFWYAGTRYKWWRDLGDLYFTTGQIDESLPCYLNALPHSHDLLQETEIHFQLAMIASIHGRHQEAEALFLKTLEGDQSIRADVLAAYRAHRQRIADSQQLPDQSNPVKERSAEQQRSAFKPQVAS